MRHESGAFVRLYRRGEEKLMQNQYPQIVSAVSRSAGRKLRREIKRPDYTPLRSAAIASHPTADKEDDDELVLGTSYPEFA